MSLGAPLRYLPSVFRPVLSVCRRLHHVRLGFRRTGPSRRRGLSRAARAGRPGSRVVAVHRRLRARISHTAVDAPPDERGGRSCGRWFALVGGRWWLASEHSRGGILRDVLWRLDAGIDVRSLSDLPAPSPVSLSDGPACSEVSRATPAWRGTGTPRSGQSADRARRFGPSRAAGIARSLLGSINGIARRGRPCRSGGNSRPFR